MKYFATHLVAPPSANGSPSRRACIIHDATGATVGVWAGHYFTGHQAAACALAGTEHGDAYRSMYDGLDVYDVTHVGPFELRTVTELRQQVRRYAGAAERNGGEVSA